MTTGNGFLGAPTGCLRFVADAGELAVNRSDPGVTVVLDPAWIPGTDAPPNVVPLHRCFDAALDGRDLFTEALAAVDRWAAATGIVDLLVIEGVSYWFRVRETLWNWVHERLLWRSAFTQLGDRWGSVSIPATETALIDVARALDVVVEIREDPGGGGPTSSASFRRMAPIPTVPGTIRAVIPGPVRRALRGIRPRPESPIVAERRERDAELGRRWERLPALPGPKILVLTLPSSYQRLGGDGPSTLRDPNLGPVVDALREGGLEPVILGWGMTRPHDDDRHLLAGDDRLLPAYVVYGRLGRPEDEGLATAAVASLLARIDAMPPVALDAEGVDLGPAFVEILRTAVQRVVALDIRELPKAQRFVDLIQPVAIVMTQEHHRTPWLLAGARAAVPTFALQHGILYRTHPGYPPIRAATVALPSCTFVHGEYARRALLAGAYEPAEVVASGSPRLDDGAGSEVSPDAGPATATGRQVIRDRLGIRPTDRLLVVSTVNLPYVRRSHVLHMIVRLLGGPLPGIHVVFKQHPGERDEWPYRELVAGLARAGGYEPPATTVVREIDLYELLRAADAHLGLHSTVLTDAVAAGTPNLIAIVEGRADMLGYVDAGVAVPVRDVSDVRAAMTNPPVPDPEARRAFLDDHFRPGDASARIVEVIRAMAG